jgi:lipopolysaccharide/colanic/teichoic acid biosynthesis glycosyltransferase
MYEGQLFQAANNAIPSPRRTYLVCKRIIDLTLAIVGLIIAGPAMALIALFIKLDSRGPVLFKQVRIGQGSQPFICYKFRTMYLNADSEVHRRYVHSLIQNQSLESASTASSGAYKLVHDPRITRVGRILRQTSLDELPQLINVIKGEMSMVGPRPPIPYEMQVYQEWHKQRLAVRPGLSGLWQVQGRSRVPFDEMVRMDLEYIARQSLWLDLKILLLTIPAVLSGKGAE